jgi:hypothetical protein
MLNRSSRGRLVGVLAISLVIVGPAFAQEPDIEKRLDELQRQVELLQEELAERDSATVGELRRQIEILTRELEELKLGREVVVEADTGLYGFGPAASKVYRVGQGVSVGGYGEMLYENFAEEREDGEPSGRSDQIDFLRAIVYVGFKFDDRFLFNSELEIEHGSTDQAGSVSVEFAYLDYRAWAPVGIRAGLVLLPMGFVNELHEPPTFLGTERPETEQRIIPSTWRENGLGIFGDVGGFAFRGHVVNGLDAVGSGSSKASGFSAEGLRGGRQKGSKAVAENFAFVGRVDYVGLLGVTAGTSVYAGNSGQGATSPLDGSTISALTVIWEGHAEVRARGFDVRALLALAFVDDVEHINAARELEGAESVGERQVGGYLQLGYDVLHHSRTVHQLIPYVRFEQVNSQDEVPEGYLADPANDLRVISIGAAWKPITNLVVKGDYQIRSNEADTGVDQLNVAIGYLF